MIPHVGRVQQKEIERCVGFFVGLSMESTAASVLLCLMYSIGISWPETETEEVPAAADCRPHKWTRFAAKKMRQYIGIDHGRSAPSSEQRRQLDDRSRCWLSASIHQLARGIYLISVLENGWLGRIKRKIVSEFIYLFFEIQRKEVLSGLKPDRFTRKNLVRCFLLVTNHLIIIICRLQEEGCKMKFRLEAPRNGYFLRRNEGDVEGKETGTIAVVLFWNGAPLRHHCRPGEFDWSYFLL